MFTTPTEIIKLALKRHREPWNWTLQCAALVGLGATMLTQSYLMLAFTLILFGVGFFALNMPEMQDNPWLRFVKRMVEWEKNWIAYPWTFHKCWRLAVTVLVACVVIWAFWTREAAVIGLLIGFVYLIKVVRSNKENEIDL
ncbi:MAG: hypothetical protein OCC46_12305 [Pseudodesulfovibrio sp.]